MYLTVITNWVIFR